MFATWPPSTSEGGSSHSLAFRRTRDPDTTLAPDGGASVISSVVVSL